MIVSELFESVLLERHADIVTALTPYSTNPNAYVTFTSIPKVGINPKVWSGAGTPIGIYAYPIQEMWTQIKDDNIPFAGQRKYACVLLSNNVMNLTDYTEANFQEDHDKLQGMYMNQLHEELMITFGEGTPEEVWERFVTAFTKITGMPDNRGSAALKFWRLTGTIARLIPGAIHQPGKESLIVWNVILRKLGYSAILDNMGIIHKAEKTQAVFLTAQACKVQEILLNIRKYSDEED